MPEDRSAPAFDRVALAEELLDTALAALRQGSFEALVNGRPRLARWLMRRHAAVLEGTLAGERDAGPAAAPSARALLLLRWGLTRLRPDRAPGLDDIPHAIPEAAWTTLPAWRPLLAVMCQARLCEVPAFPARYRRRPDEPTVDNLCGLWDVGPSSFYRYVERARRQLAQLATRPPDVAERLALRRFLAEAHAPAGDARPAWHRRQAAAARQAGHPAAALWHAVQARDAALAVELLRAHAAALAGEPETDALADRIEADAAANAVRVDLLLAQAALARTRREPERELRTLERALAAAQASAREAGGRPLLGRVYGALGRFHELRDADRAFAAYDDSLKLLRAEGDAAASGGDPALRADYVTSLIRLAWMHVLRNHPHARALLEEADALHRRHRLPDDLLGMLEQSWGEYWRIAGDLQRAVRARHRALNAFERVGDRRSVLVTYVNLVLLHGEALEEDKAQEVAQRVLAAAEGAVVEPEILVGTWGNLAFAHARLQHYAPAIAAFRRALEIAVAADLRLHAHRMRLNLASAHYGLFVQTRDPEQERLGDAALAEFMRAPASETTPSLVETAKGLKAEALAEMPDRAMPDRSIDHLLDDETAAHHAEMGEIGRRRAALRRAAAPLVALQDRMEIAAAYLRIAVREREAALAAAAASGFGDAAREALAPLQRLWADGLRQPDALHAAWQARAGTLLDAAQCAAVLARLAGGAGIGKSGYAEACGVSPATASAHLARLVALGLLVRSGRGPATLYRLPGPGETPETAAT